MKLGDSDKAEAGEHVTAVGFPGSVEDENFEDRSFAATEGSVSTARTTAAATGDSPRFLTLLDIKRRSVGGAPVAR
jgi:hypothetical protein